jgi:hypothetical protein
MNTQTLRRPRRSAITRSVALALALGAGSAQSLEVTGSFTGWWGQPEQENHGVIVSVSRRFDGSLQGVLYWAVYDDLGQPSWFLAQGPINGDTIDADLFAFEGPTFMQPDDPNSSPGEQIGAMQVQFSDCANGTVSFESTRVIVGTGGFPIRRLTNQPGTNCSGGISDNTPPTSLPEEFRVFLLPTGAISGASGKADFESRPGRTEFSVEVEDVPLGTYLLRVGGLERGNIEVVATPGGNQGEIEFRSPPEPGKELLSFNPRDQLIEVVQGNTVILDSVTPASGTVPGSTTGTPPPFGNLEVEIDLTNLGQFPAGSGDAGLEQRSNRVDFDVEIEDVPVGSYGLRIDGVDRGTIQVVATASGPEGELEFRFPAEAGKLPLDFDPRGMLIEVLDGGTAVFASTFPATGSGGGDDGGGDDGGGDDGGGGGDDGDDGDGDGPTGDIEIVVGLTNTGVYPAGSGDADFDQDASRTDFTVEIEDVPDGLYGLFVGGSQRGTISVADGEGGIEFRDPVEPGKLPLDFDPRGQTIEVREGSTVIFTAAFPN